MVNWKLVAKSLTAKCLCTDILRNVASYHFIYTILKFDMSQNFIYYISTLIERAHFKV